MRLDDIALHDLTYQLRVETRAGDLKQSLQDEGQLEPVHLVGSAPFQLVDGFRRCTAAKALGWIEVNAFVHEELDDLHAFKLAFIHNVVRKNLRPIDKANAIRLALKRGMKKLDVAEQFGLSERQVTRYLVLLKLRSEVLDAIDEREFTMAHALLFRKLDVGNFAQVLAAVKAKKMTVAQLRKWLKHLVGEEKHGKGRPKHFVSREGNRLLFHGEFSLSASWEEYEQVLEQLIQQVAFLQRRLDAGRRARPRLSRTEEADEGNEEEVVG